MIRKFPLAVVALALLIHSPGCGGGGKSESLNDQYRRAMEIADPEAKVSELLKVAGTQKEKGDSAGFEKSLLSAADAANSIADASGRATALNRIAMANARMGRPFEAKDMYRDLKSIVNEIEDPAAKAALLTRMGYTYGKYLDEPGDASSMLKRAQAAADQVEPPAGRIESLLEVAQAYSGLEMQDEMQQLLDQTLEDARAMEDLRKRSDSQANIGAMLSKLGKEEESKTIFKEAQDTAAQITDPLSQSYAYVHLGTQLKRAGFAEDGQTILQMAEDSADKVLDQSMKIPLMDKIYAARRGG